MQAAPIALFAYKRLDHLRQTASSLALNAEAPKSDLFVYSDGPKGMDDAPAVAAVKTFCRALNGFRSVTVIESPVNRGLAASIIAGVTNTVERFGRVIVLEDDMIVSPHFLKYMNDGLDRYVDDERVISIHGYTVPVDCPLPETFFIRGADCWGWATWKRGWDLFEPDGRRLLHELVQKKLIRRFNFNNTYDYLRMLRNQIKGKRDSWAIRWYASAFLRNRLTLYPGRSLVDNIGLDASGTHCRTDSSIMQAHVSGTPVVVGGIPVEENASAFKAICRFYRSTYFKLTLSNLMKRLAARIKRMARRG